MKINEFFALLALNNKNNEEDIYDSFIEMSINDPDSLIALASRNKQDVEKLLSARGYSIDAIRFRRFRALSLARLTTKEMDMMLKESTGDKEEAIKSLKYHLKNAGD